MSLHLGFHGGKCCGIKVIHGFGADPDEAERALYKIGRDNSDAEGREVNSTQRFFHLAAPAEARVTRLDRYLAYLDDRRPGGICEVVLADFQLDGWREPLEARGFRVVNEQLNSNSDNVIYVFHRNSDNYTVDDED